MIKTLNILLIVIVLFTLISVTVYAGDPPSAPTNFRTTVSGNNVVLSFIKGSGATNTVILRGDNRYPTSITDGTIVDNTTGTSVTDTNQNSEIATKYYSAWSLDNSTGFYSLTYVITQQGGIGMILLGLAIIALGLTITAFAFKLDYMKFISGIWWVGMCIYIAQQYSWFGDKQWVFIVIGSFGIALPIWFDAIRSMSRKTAKDTGASIITDDEEESEEDKEYRTAREQYDKDSAKYHSRTIRRRL